MAKYSYITDKTHNNRKIQVESAKRDGSGKNIENNYAKQNGNYQSLTAGLSNNFDTKLVMVDESAYNFRQTATMGSVELEVGSPCKVKKIVGGSVAFNQILEDLVPNTNLPNYGLTATYDSTTKEVTINGTSTSSLHTSMSNTIAVLTTHKYFVMPSINNMPANAFITLNYGSNINNGTIVTNQSELRISFRVLESGVVFTNTKIKSSIIDLTQMFGSTIADYIYSLEQANAGSGVAWFKRYFHKEYYAYNSGELVSVKTQGKKITHFNQLDKSTFVKGRVDNGNVGYADGTTSMTITDTGVNFTTNTGFRGVVSGLIECAPSTTYYLKTIGLSSGTLIAYIDLYDEAGNWLYRASSFATSGTFSTGSEAHYLRVSFQAANVGSYSLTDICINFHYDGERDGEYEPYNSETYPCDDIELRGIPQLDENNNLAFEGDEYLADGNVTRKYGTYTFTGEETWTWNEDSSRWQMSFSLGQLTGSFCISSNGIKVLCAGTSLRIRTTDNPQITSGSDINSIMSSGTKIVYPLTTPTDENSIPFTEVQECDNWGTEEWLAPTTDTRPCEVPVGHETDYLPDLKAKLEVAPTTPNENGVYVMEHNESGNSYTLLGAWLSDNGYVKPTSISGYDNTKTQTLKNVEGVLTWVDDE